MADTGRPADDAQLIAMSYSDARKIKHIEAVPDGPGGIGFNVEFEPVPPQVKFQRSTPYRVK